ncbi:MAG: hypothetical protein HUK15_08485 [Bacteroidales bacterium]|nr:hypothetical protein [Bacteroidales bacterium]
MEIFDIYSAEKPDFIAELCKTKAMRRLDDIGMNCGCEYTSFPIFSGLQKYSRYTHSIGVALIVWNFTKDAKQTIAALFHDIASPVFAHVIDFINGDYIKQESTESFTRKFISDSEEIQSYLQKLGICTNEVCDYHAYPIADNDTPRLSADRLEYTLGNIVNFKLDSIETVKSLYHDLTVGQNEENQPEIMFNTKDKALKFAELALVCSKIYTNDADRYSMQCLSEILKACVGKKIIAEKDLYTTETEVIDKITKSEYGRHEWNNYRKLSQINFGTESPKSRIIYAKKRHINPIIKNCGRVADVFPNFSNSLKQFLDTDFGYPIYGVKR